jgi:hypothetical protein
MFILPLTLAMDKGSTPAMAAVLFNPYSFDCLAAL